MLRAGAALSGARSKRSGGDVKKVYLAGPEVFAPNAKELGAWKTEICTRYGLAGVFPSHVVNLDPAMPRPAQGLHIFDVLERTMRACDGAIVNMTPFHGPSADVGTAYEMGFMTALRLPLFAYTNVPELLTERITAFLGGEVTRHPSGDLRSDDGMEVEEFGLVDNPMLDGCVRRSTDILVVASAPADRRYQDLGGFEQCVRAAARWFEEHP